MKVKVLELIDKIKDVYVKLPAIMIAAYNREVETKEEYNGRQLLEFLQNADDAFSDEVLISIDTEKNILTIANRGEKCIPFKYKGIRSLMISNLSSKIAKESIGNKGLGFRSVITWSDKITINSNGLNIIFSKEVAETTYDDLFDRDMQLKIIEDEKLTKNLKPIPLLAIPEISDHSTGEWITSIAIEYNCDYENEILPQIDELKNEILLFLNSIEKLVVKVNGEVYKEITKEPLVKKWKVFQASEILPIEFRDETEEEGEEEKYNLKIALQDNLENDIKELYSYFPTKIEVNFPFIIHGTFELNSSRNEINNSPRNRFLLEELVKLIVQTAKEITSEEVSYKALEMLLYSSKNNILKELGFYEAIDNAIEELEVFPCLDGRYRKKSDIVAIDALSTFVKKTGNEALFQNLLIPKSTDINLDIYELSGSIDDDKLNDLSKVIDSIDDRVDFIYMIHETFQHGDKLVFLIDENETLISLEDDVYTPSKLTLVIPDFVNIKFIHNELYKKLILKFGITSSDHKSRELQGKLKDITNIQEYAFVPVLRKIISSTRKKLELENIDKSSIITKMVQSLYKNYVQLDKFEIPTDLTLPLLSKNLSVVEAKNLYLSKSYPSGKLTEFLFDEIFTPDDFLAPISTYDLQEEEPEDLEEFFLRLGVNQYTKYQYKTYDTKYTTFVFKHIKKPLNYRDSSLYVRSIVKFEEIIENLSYEKIILWFKADEKIYTQLDNANNTDSFRYAKDRERNGHYYHSINIKPSYILYQIFSSNVFKDYFVGNDSLSPLINSIKFDFTYDAFETYNISKPEIESILLKIGAVDKFEKLTIDAVRRILKELPIHSPEGKQSQTLYKLCIKHFERNNIALNDEEVMLFSTKEDEKRYFPLNEVYYNGNIKLPKKITNSKAILNYPRRQSTANVIGFFGINNLSSIVIEVTEEDVLHEITNDFNALFEQIKPFILVYRIQDIEVDKKVRDELTKLQNIHIKLCRSVKYEIDGKEFELDYSDYIKNGNEYLIKIDTSLTLDEMKHKFEFQESFADIIGLVFDIQETKIFRDILKEETGYIEQTIRNDIGYEALIRAREFLGVSDEYYSFWKTIYTLLGKEYKFSTTDNLLNLIQEDLSLETDINCIEYNHLDTYESYKHLQQLFAELNLSVEDFNKMDSAYYKIDLTTYYKQKLLSKFEKVRKIYKAYIWHQLQNAPSEDQKELTQRWNDYEQIKFTNISNDLNFSIENYFSECLLQQTNVSLAELENFEMVEFEKYYFEFVKDKDENLLNILWKSNDKNLSYFKVNHDELNRQYTLLESTTMDDEEQEDDTEDQEPESEEHDTTSPPAPSPAKPPVENGNPPGGGGGEPGEKIITGKKGEEIVYKDLKAKFPRVDWVSEYAKQAGVNADGRDGYGYDITYWDKDNQQYFVEVKSTKSKSDSSIISFHMSKNEYEVAIEKGKYYKIFYVTRIGKEKPKIRSFTFNKNTIRKDIENYIITTELT